MAKEKSKYMSNEREDKIKFWLKSYVSLINRHIKAYKNKSIDLSISFLSGVVTGSITVVILKILGIVLRIK